ncbi:MAG: phage tail protein [Gemmatimonadota bacterium]
MAADARRWWIAGSNDWGEALPLSETGGHVAVVARGVRRGESTLTLDRRAGGPLDPLTDSASVGGLTLPLNMEATERDLYLASAARRRILRLDQASGELKSWIGLEPLGLRRTARAVVLTRARDLLIAAEHKRSRLVALHAGAPAVIDAITLPARVLDLVGTDTGHVLILGQTSDATRLWCWLPGSDAPGAIDEVPAATPSAEPARLLRDDAGRVYVFDAAKARVRALPVEHSQWQPIDEVLDRFAPLPVLIEAHGSSGWRMRIPPANATRPLIWPAPANWPAYDADGRRLELEPDAPAGAPPYVANGTIQIGPLDGRLPRMGWDRIELEIESLGSSTALELRTRAADTTDAAAALIEWSLPHRLNEQAGIDGNSRVDFAVLSSPARYLWLDLKLIGGSASPSIKSITAYYPRGGLVDYLPLVFRETDQDTRFLERFVTTLERSWDPLEQAVSDFDRELRPETASKPMLDYLGAWLDQPMELEWNVPARRHAVQHSAKYLLQRGTPAAVQAALRLHLANRWGLVPDSLGETPFLWEHFRSRVPLHASTGDDAQASGRLFGAEVLRRLRLGSSTLGDGTLRDVGTPETDHVTIDARRFSVFVPRTLVPTADDVRQLRNVLAHEQPADTSGELVFIEPRMRIGVQSTLGVDSILGVYPTARLAQSAEQAEDAPAARLDYDCLLSDPEPGPRPGTPALGRDTSTIPIRLT